MILRVSDALEEISEYVDGAGVDLCNEAGMEKAFKMLNKATRQLMREGDWEGMEREVCIPLSGSTLVLDDRIEAIRLAKWRGGDPLHIYSSGFKYLEGGFGESNGGKYLNRIIDLGDGFPLHRPLYRAMPIMAYSDKIEDQDTVLQIRGTDANGKEYLYSLPIYHHIFSERPPAYTAPAADYWTTGQFRDIAELRKPHTKGMVYVYGFDPSSGEMCWLTSLRPETTSPCHRRYEIPGATESDQIVAQVSMRYYPMNFEDDVLLIQNLDALSRMVQALDRLDAGDPGGYEFYKNSAISQLKKQLAKKHRPERTGLNVKIARTLAGGRNYSGAGVGGAGSTAVAGNAATCQIEEAAPCATPAVQYAPASHKHNDLYYTESEIDAKLAAIEAGEASWDSLTGKPSTFPPSTHTHDDRYYTETEVDAALAQKANKSDVLELDNTTVFTPSADYHPSTKKYVDDSIQTLGTAAAADTGDFATAAEGVLAGTALQPGDALTELDTTVTGVELDGIKTLTDYLTVTAPTDLDDIRTRVADLDSAIVLRGTWDASSGSFPGGGTAQAGALYIVDTPGTVDGVTFAVDDRIVALADNASTATYAGNWFKRDYSDAVLAVAGLTGNITASDLRTQLNVADGADVTEDAINSASSKGTIVDADVIAGTNSESSNALTKWSWSVIKGAFATYYNTLTATLTNKTLTSPTINSPALSADSVDAITEIASVLKSGADGTLITGTAGTSGNLGQFNGDGDLVDSGIAAAGVATETYVDTRPFWVEVALTQNTVDIATATKVAMMTHNIAGNVTAFKIVCDPANEPSAAAVQVDLNSVDLGTGVATSELSAVAQINTSANAGTGTIDGTYAVSVGDQSSFDIDQGSDGKELRAQIQITPT